MKKLFVSVPMRGRTEEAIKASIAKMKAIAEIYEGEELELIDTYISVNVAENTNHAVWCLGESIKKLANADIFMGCYDIYDRYPGCYIETMVARRYNIKFYRVDLPDVCPDIANPICNPDSPGDTCCNQPQL